MKQFAFETNEEHTGRSLGFNLDQLYREQTFGTGLLRQSRGINITYMLHSMQRPNIRNKRVKTSTIIHSSRSVDVACPELSDNDVAACGSNTTFPTARRLFIRSKAVFTPSDVKG